LCVALSIPNYVWKKTSKNFVLSTTTHVVRGFFSV
jgi:hypothetical protein